MFTSTRAAVVLVGVWAAANAIVAVQDRDAAQVLAAAREALGGESKLTAVKSFVATGRTRQLRGNNLVPIEFEINCELPDKYVRKDEFPAQDTDLSVAGFRGDELIAYPPPAAGRGGPPPAQRLTTVKQEFARLMLGAFATSFPSMPLTFKYAAEGEAPEGKADVIDVAGPANFSARLVVQRDTHLPVMVMWQPPAPPARAGGPPPGAASPTAAPLQENRLYFADYRAVSGIKWPFRIRRAVGADTIEETTFDRVNVNVKIDPKKFQAPK
jgi:hypothetical protein